MEESIMLMALTIIKAVIKNPKKKAALKKRLLQIRDAISGAFPSEE